ncbi:hypothetical protein BJ138DRAFT_727370 [Hygrophoropsis aurantiaca]|uniref:Uncharacterized protein n=1 Tax=Hygrophoropsis aurantiaca TaxID=72124 RepID=A0ACB7ZXF3_9AGAM|nr:hypothetical protein BJ138DRAFT_727370 [Hygrophoropsis aurantiaca]
MSSCPSALLRLAATLLLVEADRSMYSQSSDRPCMMDLPIHEDSKHHPSPAKLEVLVRYNTIERTWGGKRH